MSLTKLLQNLNKKIKKKSLFDSEESNSENENSQTGVGAPVTRAAARKRLFGAADSDSDSDPVVPQKKKKKQVPKKNRGASSGSDTDENDSPLPGPSTVLNPKKQRKKQQQAQKKNVPSAPSSSEDSDSAPSNAAGLQLHKASRDKLFEQRTPIFEDNQLEIYVAKESFKKQKIFNIEDHLYTIKIRLKSGQPPLLSSILKALEKSLDFMVKQMQLHYKDGKSNIFKNKNDFIKPRQKCQKNFERLRDFKTKLCSFLFQSQKRFST